MRKTKLVWAMLALAIVIAAAALVACGDDDDDDGGALATATATKGASSFPVTVEQTDGQKITIEKPPQRIIALSAAATETFCALGLKDQLVAVERYENCPPGSKEKPELDAFKPNLEAIAGYKPDLVFVNGDRDNIVEALRRANIPVIYLKVPTDLNGVLEQIALLGRFTGREKEAQTMIGSLRGKIDEIQQKAAAAPNKPRIYHELDPKLFTVSPKSFVGDFYNVLKAQNIAADSPQEYPQFSAEVIVQRDPEVIILSGEGSSKETPDTVRARPGWSQISAVKNNRFCIVPPNLVSRPGPHIAEGLEVLAKCLYPDLFK